MEWLRRLCRKIVPTFQDRVLEFHHKFGALIGDKPMLRYKEAADLRIRLIDEEFTELKDAIDANDLVGIADAVADLHYVISGLAVAYGIDENAVFDEVHRSNMTKLWPDGLVHYRADGKILKPLTYSPPDVKGILERQGWSTNTSSDAKNTSAAA